MAALDTDYAAGAAAAFDRAHAPRRPLNLKQNTKEEYVSMRT